MSKGTGRTIHFIMNPGARAGRSLDACRRIEAFFGRRNYIVTKSYTSTLDEAVALSRKACSEGYDTIVAVGGDGTINRVLNGFFAPDGKRISSTRLGVIHTGTSPDFCKSYGIPTGVEAACEVICTGKERTIPVGMIRYSDVPDTTGAAAVPRCISFFACCANIGIGARLATCANSGIRKYLGDVPGTFLALLRVVATWRSPDITMMVDGNETVVRRVCNISVGRTRYVASGIKIANELTDTDDRLYCLTVKNLRLHTLPGCIRSLYTGVPFHNTATFQFGYCHTVCLNRPDRPIAVEFDGDTMGYLPCKVSLAPDRLPLLYRGNAYAQ